jgi:hypothetical protein
MTLDKNPENYCAEIEQAVFEPANVVPGELRFTRWEAEPLGVERVASSFFSNAKMFPAGSALLDSGSLMRNIPAR